MHLSEAHFTGMEWYTVIPCLIYGAIYYPPHHRSAALTHLGRRSSQQAMDSDRSKHTSSPSKLRTGSINTSPSSGDPHALCVTCDLGLVRWGEARRGEGTPSDQSLCPLRGHDLRRFCQLDRRRWRVLLRIYVAGNPSCWIDACVFSHTRTHL